MRLNRLKIPHTYSPVQSPLGMAKPPPGTGRSVHSSLHRTHLSDPSYQLSHYTYVDIGINIIFTATQINKGITKPNMHGVSPWVHMWYDRVMQTQCFCEIKRHWLMKLAYTQGVFSGRSVKHSKRQNASYCLQVTHWNSGLIPVLMQMVCLWNSDTHNYLNISDFAMYYIQVPFLLNINWHIVNHH